MCDRALTANEVSVMDNVLSYQKVILGIEERERGLDNRSNMRLGGGLHNTCRLLDVYGREMAHGFSVLAQDDHSHIVCCDNGDNYLLG